MDLIALLAKMATASHVALEPAEYMRWKADTWNTVTTHPEKFSRDALLDFMDQAAANGDRRLWSALGHYADRA